MLHIHPTFIINIFTLIFIYSFSCNLLFDGEAFFFFFEIGNWNSDNVALNIFAF